jgi:ubiquinone/menaquinone biosynthesis C-methylase UbiE/DNA-binding transcriptional ArsR family regulator
MSLANYYKTIGDESRLRILNILQNGMFSVQELTSLLNLSQPTVSHHLKTLSQTGFLKSARDGNHIFYSIEEDQADPVLKEVTDSALKACAKASQSEADTILKRDLAQVQKLIELRRSKTKNYFDNVAKDWDALRSEAFGNENFLDKVVDLIEPKSCLVELGCGTGALLHLILPRPGKTIGVDYSEKMLQECRNFLSSKGESCDLRLGYMEHLPVGDESADQVIAYMSLHHVPNPRDVLKEAKRILKPNGQLIIVDLLAHDNENMREQYADVWLGFEIAELNKWLNNLNYSKIETKILGKAKNAFLLTTIK